MRDSQLAAQGVQPSNLARNETQSLGHAALIALGAEHLHTQADAEQGPLPLQNRRSQALHPPGIAQRLHAVAKGPHAGKHDSIGALQSGRLIGDVGIRADVLERSANRRQVAHTVIDDRDSHHGLS